jgi:OmpA-OmpF porin, OOP family
VGTFTRVLVSVVALAACGSPPPAKKPDKVVVTDTEIEILPAVTFVENQPDVAPESIKTLDAVAATLTGNPSILQVEVQAYVSEKILDPAVRHDLAEQRAKKAMDYLIAKGVAADRLSSAGYPDADAKRASRGVDFLVLKRKE